MRFCFRHAPFPLVYTHYVSPSFFQLTHYTLFSFFCSLSFTYFLPSSTSSVSPPPPRPFDFFVIHPRLYAFLPSSHLGYSFFPFSSDINSRHLHLQFVLFCLSFFSSLYTLYRCRIILSLPFPFPSPSLLLCHFTSIVPLLPPPPLTSHISVPKPRLKKK